MAAEKPTHAPRREDEAARTRFRWQPRAVFDLVKAAAKEFLEDKSPKQAAALAYYTLFALGPLLLLAISLAALVVGQDAARNAVTAQMASFLGASGSEAIDTILTGADRQRAGILGTILGFALLLFAAGAVFAQLKEALNRVWEVEPKKAEGWKAKIVHAVRKNFLSFAGVVGTGFLLLVSLLLSTLLAAAGRYLEGWMPGAALLWQVVNFVFTLAIVTIIFAAMYKFLPDARIAWKDVFVGAAITAALFVVGQFAIGYYLGAGPVASRFGAAGAIVLILVWVYYSSMIVFLGAETTQVYANLYGSRVRAASDAEPLREAIARRERTPEREGLDEPRGERARRGERGGRAG